MDADIAKVRGALFGYTESSEAKQALSRIAARIEELEGALKPFAEVANSEGVGKMSDYESLGEGLIRDTPNVGDCRRARAALAQEKADG